jgi:pyrroloquinoline quinone biosynthesis protein D
MNPSDPSQKVKLSRRARLQQDKVTGKPILLYPEGVLMLNQTSEAILRLCDGSLNVPEISGRLAEAYHAPAQVIEGDVVKLLERLSQLNLLTASSPGPAEAPSS